MRLIIPATVDVAADQLATSPFGGDPTTFWRTSFTFGVGAGSAIGAGWYRLSFSGAGNNGYLLLKYTRGEIIPAGAPWSRQRIRTVFRMVERTMTDQGTMLWGFGDLFDVNTFPTHTDWRLNATRRRLTVLVERSAAGQEKWYAVACSGAARSEVQLAAVATPATITLELVTSPARAFVVRVNNIERARITSAIPTGAAGDVWTWGFGIYKVTNNGNLMQMGMSRIAHLED